METVAPTSICCHATITLTTCRATEFVDVTSRLEQLVDQSTIRVGVVNVQSCHTTMAVVVNEHEPLLVGDFEALLERVSPRAAAYRHDDAAVRTVNVTPGERVNGHAHCRALLLGAAACLNIVDGRLQLGRWQRVFLAELDGPREREISVVLVGEAGR